MYCFLVVIYFSIKTFCKSTCCIPSSIHSEPALAICDFSCFSCPGTGPTSCRDYQELKIQEQVQKLAVGTIPRFMWVVLEDDLVDMCKAGDDVTVCGVVMRRWKPVYADVSFVSVVFCQGYLCLWLTCIAHTETTTLRVELN